MSRRRRFRFKERREAMLIRGCKQFVDWVAQDLHKGDHDPHGADVRHKVVIVFHHREFDAALERTRQAMIDVGLAAGKTFERLVQKQRVANERAAQAYFNLVLHGRAEL